MALGPTKRRATPARVVFLFDVENTLSNNDRIIADLNAYLKREVGPKRALRYFPPIFEVLRRQLGCADHLGALQGLRRDFPHDLGLLAVSRFLVDHVRDWQWPSGVTDRFPGTPTSQGKS